MFCENNDMTWSHAIAQSTTNVAVSWDDKVEWIHLDKHV